MPQGDESTCTDEQKRQAEHIEAGYEKRGFSAKTAEARALGHRQQTHRRRQKERHWPEQAMTYDHASLDRQTMEVKNMNTPIIAGALTKEAPQIARANTSPDSRRACRNPIGAMSLLQKNCPSSKSVFQKSIANVLPGLRSRRSYYPWGGLRCLAEEHSCERVSQ